MNCLHKLQYYHLVSRCELVSRKIRNTILHYSIYRRILDRKCRMKGINNYMIIPGNLR